MMTTTYSTPPAAITKSNKIPFKLLELNLISAQDLPAVSKSLHTYVVAWVDPDYKLITPVDHKGHTCPKWKFRMLFHVDDKFLRCDSTAVMIEIYTISRRLSNLPIGTATLPLQLVLNNPSSTSFARKPLTLPVSRPSGDVKGILNVSVNLINTTIRNRNEMDDHIAPHEFAVVSQLNRVESMPNINLLQEEEADIEDASLILSNDSTPEIVEASRASIDSKIQRLSSEVEAALIQSLYTTQNLTQPKRYEDGQEEDGRESISSEKIIGMDKDKNKRRRRRRHSDGGKLFAWIGIGFEFNFICGSASIKNHKKKRITNK